jgi:hypothetical protein
MDSLAPEVDDGEDKTRQVDGWADLGLQVLGN